MKASVLIPYFQGRRSLLERTLWLLQNQTYDNYEVWIIDDGSDEKIVELCDGRIIYERLREPGSRPRASNMAWNHAYNKCDGDFIILTHPEYMAPLDAIDRLVSQYDGSARLEPVAFALPRRALVMMDELDWKSDLKNLRKVPDFWTFKTPWGWTNMEAKEWCHHFAFTGQTREGWELTDFIPVTSERGMNDSWIQPIEIEMGRPPKCANFAVYHQHHERTTEWPFPERSLRLRRNMENT